MLPLGSINFCQIFELQWINTTLPPLTMWPLFSLNACSVTRENYYAKHWNSTSTGTSVLAYQEAHV